MGTEGNVVQTEHMVMTDAEDALVGLTKAVADGAKFIPEEAKTLGDQLLVVLREAKGKIASAGAKQS